MRSLRHLLELGAELSERKVHLQVLKQGIDTGMPQGRLVFHGAIDEFQRELIVEGTHEGFEAARARGRAGGRPRAMSADQVRLARQLASQRTADGRREYTITQVANMLGVSRPTLCTGRLRKPRRARHIRSARPARSEHAQCGHLTWW